MRNPYKYHSTMALVLTVIATGACASTMPSKELVDARRAYAETKKTQAPKLVPDRVLSARQALDAAERVHDDDPGSAAERHHAYLAIREAQVAQAYADYAAAQRQVLSADQAYDQTQEGLRKRAQSNLATTRTQLEDTQRALATVQKSLEVEGAENADLQSKKKELEKRQNELKEKLAAEKAARVAAEETAKAALASLNELAKVKEEANETTITLSGAVLFKTNKSDLLPIAEQTLAKVAEALKQQDEDSKIIVLGHTDSRGSDSMNQELSQKRAQAVADFLVRQGVDKSRITAVGKGESSPVADNKSAEGRANNRRVEIVIRKK